MSGVVTESFLVASCLGGPSSSPYPVHKITIAPFEQEMRCDMSFWGEKFGFCITYGPINVNGFSFATLGEGKGGWKSGKHMWHHVVLLNCEIFMLGSTPPSPEKVGGSLFKSVSSPLGVGPSSLNYTAPKAFNDPSEWLSFPSHPCIDDILQSRFMTAVLNINTPLFISVTRILCPSRLCRCIGEVDMTYLKILLSLLVTRYRPIVASLAAFCLRMSSLYYYCLHVNLSCVEPRFRFTMQ